MHRIAHDHIETVAAADASYRCLFRRSPAGGYVITCSELPPMLAFGETLEEARANAREEIAAWIDAAELSRTDR